MLKPDPLSSSHEGPHLIRPYDTEVFTIFWSTNGGWFWDSAIGIHGPFRTSCLAYTHAKGELLPPVVVPRPKWHSYNPRQLPTIYANVEIGPDFVVQWTVMPGLQHIWHW